MNIRLVTSRALLVGVVAFACVTKSAWAPDSIESEAM